MTEFNKRDKEPITEITDSDYYNFLNDVLKDKTIIESKILEYPDLKNNSKYWREILTPLTKTSSNERMSEILTDSDIDYIFSQFSTGKKIKLDFNKLKFDNVSDEVLKSVSDYLGSMDGTHQKKYDYWGIYHLTIPLFSKNKKYVFFDNSYYCGLLCAHIGIDVYEFKNGKWESIGSIGTIIMS
jgi:hypothetical protein